MNAKIQKTLIVAATVGCVGWLYWEPGFEPVIVLLVSLAGILAAFDNPRPLERFAVLLDDPDAWTKVGEGTWYHEDETDYRIVEGDEIRREFCEPWMESFPDPSAYSYHVNFLFRDAIVAQKTFVACDGLRYSVPLPKRNGIEFDISTSSLEFKASQLFFQAYPLQQRLGKAIRFVD